ncbi:TetR family transcriptional regulator [Actinocorallia longicatena]|uniref:TetR/AcrR family transcriptional regulator n=1 Tax=Actinocorallia longicatena TaxID=111803 RepID=A0ABP6QPM6_9ACTN
MNTRRRGDELLNAIYEAALDEAVTVGYAKTTMEGVAAAAGTGKAALYRRWPDKDALLADALNHVLPSMEALTLTDDLRTDLLAVYRHVRAAMDSLKGGRFTNMKADGGDVLIHAVFAERVKEPSKLLVLEILRRGAERGAVRPGAVTELAADTGYALFFDYCRSHKMVVEDEFLVRLVDEIMIPLVRA